MSCTPLARYKNFTLDTLKMLLEIYPDLSSKVSRKEVVNKINEKLSSYKKTAYQTACQFGLENRGVDNFEIQRYLFSFEDNMLEKYLLFWIKTYYAPNPYCQSEKEEPCLIYCDIVEKIVQNANHEIKFEDFFKEKFGDGKSRDILLNALTETPGILIKSNSIDKNILYIDEKDLETVSREVEYIKKEFPIGDKKDKKYFFERYTYKNFCKFYNINCDINALYIPNKKKIIFKNIEINYCLSIKKDYSNNRIIFGAPGTGKSYTLKEDTEDILSNTKGSYERVTFHPNYSYGSFVGTYKPVSKGENIKYEYVPGPFMRILSKALDNCIKVSEGKEEPQPYVLLVEEINRANVAAVFGEVFQMLDRNAEGVSVYSINPSEDIKKYLSDKLEISKESLNEIKIPNNMFIWSTMNSADQGVFPMDTAFKRRWDFEYIGVNDEADVVVDDKTKKKVSDYIIPIYKIDSDNYYYVKWDKLRRAINERMMKVNSRINEDKLLGPFFISKSSLDKALIKEDKFVKLFKSKVIMYLFEDAMKMRLQEFFKGHQGEMLYSALCSSFDTEGEKIFGITNLVHYKKDGTEITKGE